MADCRPGSGFLLLVVFDCWLIEACYIPTGVFVLCSSKDVISPQNIFDETAARGMSESDYNIRQREAPILNLLVTIAKTLTDRSTSLRPQSSSYFVQPPTNGRGVTQLFPPKAPK